MSNFTIRGIRKKRPAFFRHLHILLFGITTLFTSVTSIGQTVFPASCGSVNCTSNDVQVISAYISGPGNTPIVCSSTNPPGPFDGAELHLIVSSSTGRIGISLAGSLNIINTGGAITSSYPIAYCFTGVTINNGSSNNLTYSLGNTLDGVSCGPNFSLSNIFVSWGTGISNFCSSTAPMCPATPAKCSYKPGATIPVTVKLVVDYTFVAGVCNMGGNSLAVNFTPVITAIGLTAPFSYTWDFGDGQSTSGSGISSLSAIPGASHTYTSAGMYTATLTVSDANGTTNTGVHSFMLTACCNISAPMLTVTQPACSNSSGSVMATSPTGTDYQYSSDGGNTYQSSPTFPVAAGAAYSITVQQISTKCTSTATTGTMGTQPVTPDVPTINSVGPTCSVAGTSTISNYNSSNTYVFNPSGPSVGSGGLISGMTIGTSYTVTDGNTTCTSASSSSFSNAAMLATPDVPTIAPGLPTCSAAGTSTISNYSSSNTYVFNPSGPSVGGTGLISGMTIGTSYTVTSATTTCTSAPSSSFSNAAMLATPDVPTIAPGLPTCSAAGTSTISNYSSSNTYVFNPSGPSVGGTGLISGMTIGTSYTVTTGNTTCTSASSSSFSNAAMLATPDVPTIAPGLPTCSAAGTSTISNYNSSNTYVFNPSGPSVGSGGLISGMTIGTSYTVTAGNTTCTSASSSSFSNAAMLATPDVPTIAPGLPTCSAAGTSTISNYSSSNTYVFNPSGPSVGGTGLISGMTIGTSYTVTAGNTTCTSASSSSFSNAAMLATPDVPTIAPGLPTCSAAGTSTISNYNSSNTYVFNPSGPSVGSGGLISGMTIGTSYTVASGNTTCTSAPSSSFSNAPMLATPNAPTVTAGPFCSGAGTTIGNLPQGGGYNYYASSTAVTPLPLSTVIPLGTTTYYVSATGTNGCVSGSSSLSIMVNPNPPCKITRTDASSASTPVGTTASFSGPTGTGYTYVWSLTNNTSGATFVGASNGLSVSVITTKAGSYTVTLMVTAAGCSSMSACASPITVTPIGPYYTYTQGFYGNAGGKACNGANALTIMKSAIPISQLFGVGNRSFTLYSSDFSGSRPDIFVLLLGGATPNVLGNAASYGPYITASYGASKTWPVVPLTSKGSIGNVLLAQTIALYFNLSYSSTLGNLVLTGNVITFAVPTTACGSNYGTIGTTQTIPCSVFNYLANHGGVTINNLYTLANQVLGASVTSISASDVNSALNAINVGFDNGAKMIGITSSCGGTTSYTVNENPQIFDKVEPIAVTAYPNPFTDKVKFVIESPVGGQASLDIYDILGRRIANAYQGYLFAGSKQIVEYNASSIFKGTLIYILRVGDKQINGKVIQVK